MLLLGQSHFLFLPLPTEKWIRWWRGVEVCSDGSMSCCTLNARTGPCAGRGSPLSGQSRHSRHYVQQLSAVEESLLSNFYQLPHFLYHLITMAVAAVVDFFAHFGERICLVFFGHHQFHWLAAFCTEYLSCWLCHLFVSHVNRAIIAPSPSARPLIKAMMAVTTCFILLAPCLVG